MSEPIYENLLKRMPAMAEAVNAFKSESVQQRAFQLLVKSLVKDLSPEDVSDSQLIADEEPDDANGRESANAAKGDAKPAAQKPRKRTLAGPPKVLGEMNLKPEGKKSLKGFVTEKKPNTNEERFAVIIHYLQHTLKMSGITRDHVHTGFKDIGVKSPVEIDAALRMASVRKGWIDTSNSADLKMKVAGENLVEHDLPRKEG